MTKTPETRLWANEFGYAYDVPESIDSLVAKGELTDNSWHNDVMPHFIRRDGLNLWSLWVDHPEQEMREFPDHNFRYSVFHCLSKYSYPEGIGTDDDCKYQGNDLEKALSAILNSNGTYPAKNDPEPDSPEWFDTIARKIKALDSALNVETYHAGGGIWGISIIREDETDIFWGTANDEWGADVIEMDGDISDNIHIAIRSDESDLDKVARNIITATISYEPIKAKKRREFKQLQRNLYDAAAKLLNAWDNGDEYTTDYPFKESFDEVVAGIGKWIETTEGETK